jgi:ribosomal protein S18 acetylase RimI-like enzyme
VTVVAMGDRWWEPIEPVATPAGVIRVVDPAELVALRRAVLRDGRPDLPASYPSDDEPSSLHLGLMTPVGRLAGCVTVLEEPFPGFASLHLVLMAVDPDLRRQGVGRALVGAVQGSAAAAGRNVWAAARLTALEFYVALGFTAMGDVFTGAMDLPHRRVLWRSR